MNYNFTEAVRALLALAREESLRLQHDYVGTEHILLGLLREGKRDGPDGRTRGQDLGMAALRHLGVRPGAVEERIRDSVRVGKAATRSRDLPYTSRAKKVLEYAMAEARDLGHAYVGTEHVLLGLLREEKGIAAQVLAGFGVTAETARAAVTLHGAASPIAELGIEIDDASDVSIYEQIVARIREAIATGELKPGDRLPPVRGLADRLDIAPGTVARAYSQLERLGVVVTEGARGTRVAERTAPARARPLEPDTLAGLLRPVAVAAFHMGASATDLRGALDEAMKGIFP